MHEKEYSFHSYENKEDRPIKVMAKQLHHSCDVKRIVYDLQHRGYRIIEASPKLKYKTKQPLNMFMLSFRKEEDVNKIFGITDIMGMRVEIVPLKKNKLIPQCKNCQAYGHTKKYCGKQPRCVRCTGNHSTSQCDKPVNANPQCIHCGGSHPANYRGCMVAKELQKIKNKQMKKPFLPHQPQRVTQRPSNLKPAQEKDNAANNKQAARPYNVVASNNIKETNNQNQNKNKTDNQNQNKSSIDATLNLILDKLNALDRRITNLENRSLGAIPKVRNG